MMSLRMALLISLAFAVVSCGGEGEETAPSSSPSATAGSTIVSLPTRHVISDADAAATSSAQLRKFRDSAEYQAAHAAAQACLAEAGYVPQPDGGVMLHDGTIFKPGPGGQAVRGAYLQFRIDQERCSEDSGLYDVAARAGYQMRPQLSPADLTSMNTQTISVVQCLKDEGWVVPEPRTLHGLLVIDIPDLSDEEEAAWLEDQAVCYENAR